MPLISIQDNSPVAFVVPDGIRVYAIGDLHGRVDLLRKLQAMIRADVPEKRTSTIPTRNIVIYLGDYVDRGDRCQELIDLILDDPIEGATTFHLRGNHEQKVLDFLQDEETGPKWIFWGGDATLRSYGVDIEDPRFGQEGWSWLQDEFRKRFPDRHLSFLENQQFSHIVGDYFFTHAGVNPGIPLLEQSPKDLMWIRKEFLNSDLDFGKKVVHGHTIVDDVTVLPNRIAIDTGAWRTNKLSCLVLEQEFLHVLQT